MFYSWNGQSYLQELAWDGVFIEKADWPDSVVGCLQIHKVLQSHDFGYIQDIVAREVHVSEMLVDTECVIDILDPFAFQVKFDESIWQPIYNKLESYLL